MRWAGHSAQNQHRPLYYMDELTVRRNALQQNFVNLDEQENERMTS